MHEHQIMIHVPKGALHRHQSIQSLQSSWSFPPVEADALDKYRKGELRRNDESARIAFYTLPSDANLFMLHTASNARAVEVLPDALLRHYEEPLAALIGGAQAIERPDVCLAMVAVFQLMRKVIVSRGLADAFRPTLY